MLPMISYSLYAFGMKVQYGVFSTRYHTFVHQAEHPLTSSTKTQLSYMTLMAAVGDTAWAIIHIGVMMMMNKRGGE